MSIAEKFNIPPALLETIKKMNAEGTEYQEKVKALMKKRGFTSIGQMSPEEKKDFFNTLDSMHKAKNEEVELDEAIPKSTGHALVHSSSGKIIAKGNKAEMQKKMKELNAKEKGSHYVGRTSGKAGDTFGFGSSPADKLSVRNEEVDLDEAKSSTGYDLYHKDFSSAMSHAYDFAKKKYNIEIDPTEIDRNVAMGPRKPGSGKANAYRLLDKTGKKAIQVQVANLDNKRYELNMYKEEVDLDEGKYGAFRVGPKRPRYPYVPQGNSDPRTGLPLGFTPGKDKKSEEPKKVKEDIELTESHFKVGQRVECLKSGMKGTVVKVDKPEVGKYYTVKQDSGKMMKYAPDELKALSTNEAKEEGASKKKEAEFHKKLDTIVHKTFGKRPEEMKESDASWAKSKEMEKEKRLTPSDRDKLAKIRAMMAKQKKPMKEEEEIEEASGIAVKQDAAAQMNRAKLSMQMANLRVKQATERESLMRKKEAIREEVEELDEGLSAAQIKTLRDAYASIDKIDVSGQPYKNLVAFLDKQDLKTLKMLAGAKIKFISGMAQNRVVRKMNESIGSTVGGALGQYAGAKMGLEGPGRAHGKNLGRALEYYARLILHKLTKEELEQFESESEEHKQIDEVSGDVAKRVAQRRDQDFRKNTPTETQKRRMGRGDWRADPQLHADRAEKSAIKRGAKDVHGYNESYHQLFAEAAKKMKKEATSKDNNKSVMSGDKLSGKKEPIEINPEMDDRK